MRCLKADITSVRAQKNLTLGNLAFLEDFDFNILGKLSSSFKVASTITGVADVASATADDPIPMQTRTPRGG